MTAPLNFLDCHQPKASHGSAPLNSLRLNQSNVRLRPAAQELSVNARNFKKKKERKKENILVVKGTWLSAFGQSLHSLVTSEPSSFLFLLFFCFSETTSLLTKELKTLVN